MILIPLTISKNGFTYYFTPIETSIPFVYHMIYINPIRPFTPAFHKLNLDNLKRIFNAWVSEGFTDFKVVKEFEYILKEHLNGSDT